MYMVLFEDVFTLYKLKEVERKGTVGRRQESAAEHVYSSLMLAQFFLPSIRPPLSEKNVMRILLYHDLVEIHAGDTFILDEKAKQKQKSREEASFRQLCKELPEPLASTFQALWEEYTAQRTAEAKFCKAIDELDAVMHSMFKPDEWKQHGFTEKKLRQLKEHHLEPFPPLHTFFNDLIDYLHSKNSIPSE